MSEQREWAEIVTRCPELGDLLAALRSYRGDNPQRAMWAPGGIENRMDRLIAATDWGPDGDTLNAYEAALGILWAALPAQKGEPMDMDRDSMTLAEREAAAIRGILACASDFQGMADKARAGAVYEANGQPVTAEFLAALAQFAAAMTTVYDYPEATIAASDRIERTLAGQPGKADPE